MDKTSMYWVSKISSWNYIDVAGRTHGRIDWFEDIRDIGYWWQTAHENGTCFSIESAKRNVELAAWRRNMVLAALYEGVGGTTLYEESEAAGRAPARGARRASTSMQSRLARARARLRP